MTRVDLRHGSATDVGHVRQVNEDSFLALPPVFAVADGMGGHSGGDVASRIAVEEFSRVPANLDLAGARQALADAFSRAQARIVELARAHRAEQPGWHAGTTAVVAVAVEDAGEMKWLVANIGDSRIYRWNHDGLEQVSVDHSVVQELVDAGQIRPEQAAGHPERHVITRALGSPEGIGPDFFLLPLGAGERLLLCSDGVNGMVSDDVIARVLSSVHDPHEAAEALVGEALAAGGHDNATAVIVDVVGFGSHDTRLGGRQ